MNKTDLIYSIAKKCNIPKKHSRKVVDIIIDNISTSLAGGEQVQVLGFGSFETRERAARKGRNPQTGEEITIPATKYAVFHPCKELKNALNSEETMELLEIK
ncbi:HU family DNA-binding protein [Robertmurraya korlensis]|uniref:HU family DNA-binding protein n=1 Tax=Robertmurraya korlensis TaxID=519977 RepID=UPI0020412AC5|nr:HU family DNA-binding protein [Robertmurraya korlensis]MCM3601219.1 HU family DNA-binding protein [Robertmurraya korlensis]